MTFRAYSPEGDTPKCVRSASCPVHSRGACAERETGRSMFHPDSDRGWPRQGDLVTARSSGSVYRTGKLVDFCVIQTSPGNEYGIAVSTIRRPDWGVYCRHGLKLVEAKPAERTLQGPRPLGTPGRSDWSHQCSESKHCPACYPIVRKVHPWPCDENGCTEADFDRAQEQEIEEYCASLADHARADW